MDLHIRWRRQHVNERVGDVVCLYAWHFTVYLLGHLLAEARTYDELCFHQAGADALQSNRKVLLKRAAADTYIWYEALTPLVLLFRLTTISIVVTVHVYRTF